MFVSSELIRFLSVVDGTHLIYKVSVGWSNFCSTINEKSLVADMTGNSGEYASIVKLNVVLVSFANISFLQINSLN